MKKMLDVLWRMLVRIALKDVFTFLTSFMPLTSSTFSDEEPRRSRRARRIKMIPSSESNYIIFVISAVLRNESVLISEVAALGFV